MALLSNLVTILNKDFQPNQIRIGEITFGGHYAAIPYLEIVDVYVINDKYNSHDTFSVRLEKLKTNKGWVHLAGGLSLGINLEHIEHISMDNQYLEPLERVNRNELLERLGKPHQIQKDTLYDYYYDAAPDAFLWQYPQWQLQVWFDLNYTHIIKIQIGEMDIVDKKTGTWEVAKSWIQDVFGNKQSLPPPIAPKPRRDIYQLQTGKTYQVVHEFVDYDRIVHQIGEKWVFDSTNYVPYHSGMSLFVIQNGEKTQFRFQDIDEEQGELLATFMEYVQEAI